MRLPRKRLVGAMMLEHNDKWSLNRCYESPQTLSDTAPTRLSALAR